MEKKLELTNRIITEFPDFQDRPMTLITDGCDNDIIIVDNAVVFRFPRNRYVKNMMQREMQLLHICAPYIRSCSIPNPKYISKKGDFWGYDIVPGEGIQKKHGMKYAQEIAVFLNELHNIPTSTLETCNFEHIHYSITPSYLEHIASEIESNCVGILSPDQIDQTHRLLLTYANIIPESTCLVHRDLTGNMLEKNRHFSGVIDFSDAAIFDPAEDFARLYDWGVDFAHMVLSHYFADSPAFREKTYWYHKKLLLTKLTKRVKDSKKLEIAIKTLGL